MEYLINDKKTAEAVLMFFLGMKDDEAVLKLIEDLNQKDVFDAQQASVLRNALTAYDLVVRDKKDIIGRLFPGYSVPAEIPEIPEEQLKELRKILRQKDAKPAARKMYISDMHFYHQALNRQMDNRGFRSHHEMNEYMIEQWNKKVTGRDEVYILGDLSIAKGKATNEIVRQLKGKLYLIEGNHDRYLKDKEFNTERFKWIRPYAEINDMGRKVVLSHYPVFCYNGQYKRQDGIPYVYMLYGHVHDTYDEVLVNRFIMQTREAKRMSKYTAEPENIPCNMINCFCMFSDYQPLTLDEWIEKDSERRKKLNERSQNAEGQ